MAVTPYFGDDAVTLFPQQDALELLRMFQARGGGGDDRAMYDVQQAEEMRAADARAGRMAAANSEMAPAAAGAAVGYGVNPRGGTSGMSPADAGYAAGFRGAPAATPVSTPPPPADPVRDAMMEQLATNKRMMDRKLFDARYGDEILARNTAAFRGPVDFSGTQPLAHYQDQGQVLLHAMGQYDAEKNKLPILKTEADARKTEADAHKTAAEANSKMMDMHGQLYGAQAGRENAIAGRIGGGLEAQGTPAGAAQFLESKEGQAAKSVILPGGLDPATGRPRAKIAQVIAGLKARGLENEPWAAPALRFHYGPEIDAHMAGTTGWFGYPDQAMQQQMRVIPGLVPPGVAIPPPAAGVPGRGEELMNTMMQGYGSF